MNIEDLTNKLASTFLALERDEMDYSQAKELANVAGKIIQSAKVNLEYYEFMKYKNKIKFLEPKGRPIMAEKKD